MKTGVQKLFEAAEQVQEITQELVSKEKHMAIANTEAAKVRTRNSFLTKFFFLYLKASGRNGSFT